MEIANIRLRDGNILNKKQAVFEGIKSQTSKDITSQST